MASYVTNKLVIRDSFDDEDVSDDVDDEVFIRDGKNGFKVDEERGVKRPLMAPRRKFKTNSNFNSEICKNPPCRAFCIPFYYGFIAVASLAALFGIVSIVVIFVNMFPLPLERIHLWTVDPKIKDKSIIPCLNLRPKDVWIRSFPKLTSEAALKLNDVNQDEILDIIVGYGTVIDDVGQPDEICKSYPFKGPPCFGGVLALDGQTGETIWQFWTRRIVLSVDCSVDINNDKINDCLYSGMGGLLGIIRGNDGKIVWELPKPQYEERVDVYSAQFVADVDGDDIPDVLASHTSSEEILQGHLLLLSGRTGHTLSHVNTPGEKETILSTPQLLVSPDGQNVVVFATGGLDSSEGGLYAVPLLHLLAANISENRKISKGAVIAPPVLVDLSGDGTEDIVVTSGDQVIVFDGCTFKQIWNSSATTPKTENMQLLNSPTPGYFNDDETPDLLVTHLAGNSFPEYYFSQTTVLDGKKGSSVLDTPTLHSGTVDAPGITVSYSGIGNDVFLFWVAVCVGHENSKEKFSFIKGTDPKLKPKADLCKLRFNSSLEMRLYALSQHVEPPGILLYSSEARWSVEHNGTAKEKKLYENINIGSTWAHATSATSFHHKGDSVQHLKAAPHHPPYSPEINYQRQQISEDDLQPMTYTGFDRRPNYRRPHNNWRPQEATIGEAVDRPGSRRFPSPGMDEGMNLDQLQDFENIYNQEAEDGIGETPLFPADLGRDERANLKASGKTKRSIPQATQSIPRIVSAGSLVPSLNVDKGVDLVFASHWLPAATNVRIRLPQDDICIKEKLEQSHRATDKYTLPEELEGVAEQECLFSRGISSLPIEMPSEEHLQLTIYRLGLECSCERIESGVQECSQALPYAHQSWPNRGSNVYFKVRQPFF